MISSVDELNLPTSRDVLDIIPEHFGPRLNVRKGGVALTVQPPGTIMFKMSGDLVGIFLSPVQRFETRVGGEVHLFSAPTGGLVINPAEAEGESRWSSSLESLTIGFQPGYLGELAAQEFGIDGFQLHPPPFGRIDRQALQVAHLLRQELSGEAPNELFVDSLMTAAGLHVIRTYSAPLTAPRPKIGELSSTNARKVREFLAKNFRSKLSISCLAALCGVSQRHFIQAFGKTFGTTPHRYVINARLNEAVSLLSEAKLTIAEVAYLSGFSSQSHLTSTMKRYRGKTPAQIRKKR